MSLQGIDTAKREPMEPNGQRKAPIIKQHNDYFKQHALKDRERYLLIIVLKDVLCLELYFDQNLIYYVYSSCFFFP